MNENYHIATYDRPRFFRAMGFVTCLVLLVIVPPLSSQAQQTFAYAGNSSGAYHSTTGSRSSPAATELLLPGAFTPDGDGINDLFSVNMDGLTSCMLVIYDRLGTPVYQCNSGHCQWDGTVENQRAPMGVYFYEVKAQSTTIGPVYKAGTVTLTYRY